jgi:hypothetical protein
MCAEIFGQLLGNKEMTYALPILVRNVTILQGKFDLFLILIGDFVIAIDHVGIALSSFD